MEPRIQYAKTEDGVNIAYFDVGGGTPLVNLALPSHLSAEWRAQESLYEQLAKDWRVVRFDHRGFGLSDREVDTVSLDAYVQDLEAVVDQLQLSPFIIYSPVPTTTPIAIAYAARHPDKVTHLFLTGAARMPDEVGQQIATTLEMPGQDWDFLSEALARLFLGWNDEEMARLVAGLFRKAVDLDGCKRFFKSYATWDVTELLPLVSARTLVTNPEDDPYNGLKEGRELTAGLQNAEFVALPAASNAEQQAQRIAAARAFLGAPAEPSPAGVSPAPPGTATILFTDMASSTSLTQQLGDAAAQEVLRTHNDIVRSALAANAGTEIKHTGDGIMASFSTASSALNCAIAVQRGVAAHKDENPDSPLAVYVGLNAGEPIAEDDDLFGTSINLAARICDHAEAGQIVAADVVRQLAAGKDFLFSDLGETELRGFEDPVKLWELRWQRH
ncbi:MAG: adenylate/guanylate cyclase domain-containing protein [Chloroflexi bacterium]|nr:adenylate/guanylate cyclase domain-containing protein [Chloroflexota bacterium]